MAPGAHPGTDPLVGGVEVAGLQISGAAGLVLTLRRETADPCRIA